MTMRKSVLTVLGVILLSCMCMVNKAAYAEENGSVEAGSGTEEKIQIRILILPKFEIGAMTDDIHGEAQYYYEGYLDGCETFEIPHGEKDGLLYYKDGVALYMVGMGKVNSALSTMAVLSDERFDFSEAYIISTGCAGSAKGYGVMGDVYITTAIADYDLGHHGDVREMTGSTEENMTTWFHDPSFDEQAVVRLDEKLTDQVYDLVKDVPLETTEYTRNTMRVSFEGEEWADRDPMVLKGTSVTGDNYWKGEYDHANALLIVETYDLADPYAATEMEDIAVAAAVERMGLLDHFLVIRDSVNMDVFMQGATPESLWSLENDADISGAEEKMEILDGFDTAMRNNYIVGSKIIDAILYEGFNP